MSLPKLPQQSGSGLIDHSDGRFARAVSLVRDLGPAEIIRRARSSGLQGTLNFIGRNIRHQIAHHQAKAFDRREGVDTAGSIQLNGLTIVGPNKAFGNEAVSTSPKSFTWLLNQAPIPEGATFVDIGCGKGRTVLLASQRFEQAVGVEFASELVTLAKQNTRAFANKHPDSGAMSIVCQDAADYKFSDGPLLVYFYNPFSEALFRQVIGNLVASLAANPRPCTVIYATGMNTQDWAERAVAGTGRFAMVNSGRTPSFSDAIRRLSYAIFTFSKPQ